MNSCYFCHANKNTLNATQTTSLSFFEGITASLRNYAALVKVRLTLLVVFSAVAGYFIASPSFDLIKFLAVVFGGFMVTGASNTLNQILEKDSDKLMVRTQKRPLPANNMSLWEAMIFGLIMAFAGITILWFFLNPLSGLLGTMALVMYAGIYTPMKKASSWAVFVGAFPGAIPPMLGYVAETGQFGLYPGLLFAIQFIWQFPHFWAIAWVSHGEYKKAGMHLLPSSGGKDKSSAFQMLVYSLFLLPLGLTPFIFGMSGVVSAVIITLCGIGFSYFAAQLLKNLNDKAALKLMFASFVYLPVVQIALWLDKI